MPASRLKKAYLSVMVIAQYPGSIAQYFSGSLKYVVYEARACAMDDQLNDDDIVHRDGWMAMMMMSE